MSGSKFKGRNPFGVRSTGSYLVIIVIIIIIIIIQKKNWSKKWELPAIFADSSHLHYFHIIFHPKQR